MSTLYTWYMIVLDFQCHRTNTEKARFGGRRDYDKFFRVTDCPYMEAALTPFHRDDTTRYLREFYATSLRCRALNVSRKTSYATPLLSI